jgi:hypothetical protein
LPPILGGGGRQICPRKIIAALTVAVALGLGTLAGIALINKGQQYQVDYDKQALVRTATEHAALCGRLGIPGPASEHAACLRELDSLKNLHNMLSAEGAAGVI